MRANVTGNHIDSVFNKCENRLSKFPASRSGSKEITTFTTPVYTQTHAKTRVKRSTSDRLRVD